MKVPVSWLRDYVAFDLPLDELAGRLVFPGSRWIASSRAACPGRRTTATSASASVLEAASTRTPTGCS